ncbi:GcrA cell cycle regulator [Rhodovastum atsumiense]|uniref:GcrA cell cycle regulator n=1 Tax=Rhodovastum atsumiense TaxID=504468 RepID=A0A5M6IJB7_9PROT|nr:GcrA family cell cycle regulator [Rhodovastum atsumiense]KAA5608363.1 GcrA cell cycle regulator [Rhodovastum atsumiense]CAH2600498.1 GcrA cell cycle regulator [Rhodovastum atsumiense]
MEWNDETIARLRELWAEGHSTAEIGRRMCVSKNAVVGKAHRLNLPARPSPIRRDGVVALPRPAAARRVTGPTLPPLVAAEPAAATAPRATASVTVSEPPPKVAPIRPVAAVRPVRAHTCCWPLGEPGTRSFRFCDAEALPGKPYCAEHAGLAYVKVRDKREEAA